MAVLCIERYGVATVAVFEEMRRPLVHETRQHGLRHAAQFGIGQMHFDPLPGRYLHPAGGIPAAGPALDLRAKTGEPLRPFLEGPLRPLEQPARQRIVLPWERHQRFGHRLHSNASYVATASASPYL